MPDLFTHAQETREAAAAAVAPAPPAPAKPSAADRIARAFAKFHAANPEVYRRFCERVQALRDVGHDQYSADGILHVIRYQKNVNPNRDGKFKINNDFSALYSRLWQDDHPAAAEFFETRVRKSQASA